MIYLNPSIKRSAIISGMAFCFILQVISLFIPSLFYTRVNISDSNLGSIFLFSRVLLWVSLLLTYIYSTKVEKQSFLLYEEKKYDAGFYILSVVSLIVVLLVLSFTVGFILKLTGL